MRIQIGNTVLEIYRRKRVVTLADLGIPSARMLMQMAAEEVYCSHCGKYIGQIDQVDSEVCTECARGSDT